MHTFIRAVVTGFGFSLGSAIYKKVSKKLGFDDDGPSEKAPPTADGAEEGDADGTGADGDDRDASERQKGPGAELSSEPPSDPA